MGQVAEAADHLGQVYDKQGKRDAAIHMWRLALASNINQEGAKERLQKANEPIVEPIRMGRSVTSALPVSAAEELGKLRTIHVPALPKQSGIAKFFLLVSQHGIEDVLFMGGADFLKNAAHAIQTAKYDFAFPDEGPEKIIRRGILSCSNFTKPSCQLTLLLPAAVRKDSKPN